MEKCELDLFFSNLSGQVQHHLKANLTGVNIVSR